MHRSSLQAHLRRRRVAGGNCGKWWYPSDTHPTTAPDHIIHPITSSRVDSPTRTQNVPRRSYKGTLRVADIMDAHLDLTYTEFKRSQNVHFSFSFLFVDNCLHSRYLISVSKLQMAFALPINRVRLPVPTVSRWTTNSYQFPYLFYGKTEKKSL
jgi:hypothetical protein